MKIEQLDWIKSQLPWSVEQWDSLVWKKVAGVATGVCVTWFVMRRMLKRRQIVRKLEMKRAEVKASCQRLVDLLQREGVDMAKRDRIVSLTITELQSELQTGKLTALEVLRAYQSKAMEVNEKLNCITEPVWEAEAQARALDEYSGVKGPLHGIPVSIKEGYVMKGYDCTGGYLHFVNKPREEDGAFVEVLRQQGAVPFVRTNIPQTMLTFDSSNLIFGATRNPYDLTRGPGGSSSGEGALIGGRGCLLGIGNDIGGSVRMPAHMCGICSLKPTSERLGVPGMLELGLGVGLIKVAGGPMGRDVESLVMFMQALLVPSLNKEWPFVQVQPFDMEEYTDTRPLRIGYFYDNKVVAPVPSVVRAVDVGRRALEKRGHTLVRFEPPRVQYMFTELFAAALTGDNAEESRAFLENDLLDPCARQNYYTYQLPYTLRYILGLLMHPIDPELGKILRQRIRNLTEWFHLGEMIEVYKGEFVAEMKKQKLDVILSPTMPMPAIPLHTADQIIGGMSYTGLYNVLNFPAGCVPVTKVTAKDQSDLNNPSIYPAKKRDERNVRKLSQGGEGLPVSVQCAALPYQEELVLRVLKEIQDEVTFQA